jgi:hypothetical protein
LKKMIGRGGGARSAAGAAPANPQPDAVWSPTAVELDVVFSWDAPPAQA